MPFVEAVGNVGTVPFSQITKLVPKPNVGTILGATVTVNVKGKAHNPAVGVNVYTSEFWLSIIDGFQDPVIPLSDVAGKDGTLPDAHIDKLLPKTNVGVIFGSTVRVKEVVVAHCPASGVNV